MKIATATIRVRINQVFFSLQSAVEAHAKQPDLFLLGGGMADPIARRAMKATTRYYVVCDWHTAQAEHGRSKEELAELRQLGRRELSLGGRKRRATA